MKNRDIANMLANLDLRIYLVGYSGLCVPRWLRKVLARTRWHRSWLEGHMAIFIENGRRYSICDRYWLRNRKDKEQEISACKLIGELLRK